MILSEIFHIENFLRNSIWKTFRFFLKKSLKSFKRNKRKIENFELWKKKSNNYKIIYQSVKYRRIIINFHRNKSHSIN